MPENYIKPWLSIDDQLSQLCQRGMVISDPAKARDYLDALAITGLAATVSATGEYLLRGSEV